MPKRVGFLTVAFLCKLWAGMVGDGGFFFPDPLVRIEARIFRIFISLL
jgi:hypothetical protein